MASSFAEHVQQEISGAVVLILSRAASKQLASSVVTGPLCISELQMPWRSPTNNAVVISYMHLLPYKHAW